MRLRDFIPVGMLGGLAAFVFTEAADVARARPAGAAPRGDRDSAPTLLASEGGRELRAGDVAPPPVRDRAAIERTLAREGPSTFIGEVLASEDSTLVRWPDRSARPLRVWVQPYSPIADWQSDFVPLARQAFAEWAATGIPVHFIFVADSARSDIELRWIDHFEIERRIGNTHRVRDQNGWIDDARISIAMHTVGGRALDTAMVRLTALHEVGHLLGLDHTDDSTSIMTARSGDVPGLGEVDRRTIRLLYSLPPGSVKR